jgi:hypothetical protein
MYASDLQTLLAVKEIEKDVETHDTCLQSIVNSDRLNQTKLAYKIDTGLKTIVTSIQKFGKVVVESTDIGGNRSTTIIWACFSFFLAKVNSQGFDSTTTFPNVEIK